MQYQLLHWPYNDHHICSSCVLNCALKSSEDDLSRWWIRCRDGGTFALICLFQFLSGPALHFLLATESFIFQSNFYAVHFLH